MLDCKTASACFCLCESQLVLIESVPILWMFDDYLYSIFHFLTTLCGTLGRDWEHVAHACLETIQHKCHCPAVFFYLCTSTFFFFHHPTTSKVPGPLSIFHGRDCQGLHTAAFLGSRWGHTDVHLSAQFLLSAVPRRRRLAPPSSVKCSSAVVAAAAAGPSLRLCT